MLPAAAFLTGCGNMENKLGRGVTNATEIMRLGELRRSVEQTAVWDSPEAGMTAGVFRGINRTILRTAIGFGEILTAPIPVVVFDNYEWPERLFEDRRTRVKGEPMSVFPAYPDNYRPGLFADSVLATDTNIGFSGGDAMPLIPGSRFRVFDH